MRFDSLEYLIFLAVVTLGYFTLPSKMKNYWLLAFSYFFYMQWNAKYSLLMLFSTLVTYASSIFIESEKNKTRRKIYLYLCLFICLSVLFVFKYFNFASEAVASAVSFITNRQIDAMVLDIILPVGISFYTFQALGYSIDVYRGEIKAERNIARYALFISFFPQLVAGPIERASNMLRQFYTAKKFEIDRLRSGLLLIGWGLFKKMVIADRLAVSVNYVYNNPDGKSGIVLVFATVAFAFQIYCDFSAYSDIAKGSAGIIGFDLMQNFNKPYFAVSIKDFWRRWHVSLSSWFKDYLYFPLGGNRKGDRRKYANLLIVFMISGVWHGAGFTFIIWGALNGLYQVIGELFSKFKQKFLPISEKASTLPATIVKIAPTFALTCFAWIFFRANSIGDALYVVRHIPVINSSAVLDLGCDKKDIFIALASVLVLLGIDFVSMKKNIIPWILKQRLILRWSLYSLLILAILIFGVYGGSYTPVDFLYFQF